MLVRLGFAACLSTGQTGLFRSKAILSSFSPMRAVIPLVILRHSTVRYGYRISDNWTSGPVLVIVKRGLLMRSIAYNLVNALLLLAICATASAAPPHVLQDPLLGLLHDPSTVRFESAPASLLAQCPFLAGSDSVKSVWFVYARTVDASGRTFYLLNGYEIRLQPSPPEIPQYEPGVYGILVVKSQDRCSLIDADARRYFSERIFDDELPQDALQRLSVDFASRMSKAFGGERRLKAEMRNQRVDPDTLPEELRRAFRTFTSTSK